MFFLQVLVIKQPSVPSVGSVSVTYKINCYNSTFCGIIYLLSRVFYFHNTPRLNISASNSTSYTTFPYKWNNNKDGSFSFVTSVNDTKPTQYITCVSNGYRIAFSKISATWANNMMEYTYAIHWGRTLGILADQNVGLFYDRCGVFTDDLLNYEDTELISAIRSKFNMDVKEPVLVPVDTYNSLTSNTNSDIIENATVIPNIYAVFALNNNDSNFTYNSFKSFNYGDIRQNKTGTNKSGFMFAPVLECNKLATGDNISNGRKKLGMYVNGNFYFIRNSFYNMYSIVNNSIYVKKFLGYFKGPNALEFMNMKQAVPNNSTDNNAYLSPFESNDLVPVQVASSVKLEPWIYEYTNVGDSNVSNFNTVKILTYGCGSLFTLPKFQISKPCAIDTSYTYLPSETISTTQLEHIHLTQILDYRIGTTTSKYTSLLSKFGLNKSRWSTNWDTNSYLVDNVVGGFSDGFVIQSPYNEEGKIYYGTTLPYVYDGYVDWNNQNRTSLNAGVSGGITGIIGGILGGLTFTGNSAQQFTYDVGQFFKGAPTYQQQLRQARIANPGNLMSDIDSSMIWSDMYNYVNSQANGYTFSKTVIYATKLTSEMIQEANSYLRKFGFGGKSRYLEINNAIPNYSGYIRLTNNSENYSIFYNIFSTYYNEMMNDEFVKQFCVKEYNEIINEGVTWLCGGFYY